MRLGSIKLLLVLVFYVIPHLAVAAALNKTALTGRWEYTSYTILQKGKPSGTVQFKPGTMLFTYRSDETWDMEAADATHTRLNGSYEIHGTELVMKKADGSPYQDFDVRVENNGKTMTLKDKHSLITASKVDTAP